MAFKCACSHERVVRAVLTMGLAEMRSLLAEQGEARATCEFCGKKYLLPGPELAALIRKADESPHSGN